MKEPAKLAEYFFDKMAARIKEDQKDDDMAQREQHIQIIHYIIKNLLL